MNKFRYSINNLDCANCARKIEEMLNKHEDFRNVSVNFNTCKISYESDKNYSLDQLNKIIKKAEPDVYITKNDDIKEKKEFHFSILIIALIIGVSAYLLPLPSFIKIGCYIISYGLLLYKIVINAFKLLIKGKQINENALISISCIGALIIGEIMEGLMVITLYIIGKILEEKAVNNSRKSIKDLIDIKAPFANKKVNNEIINVMVEDVQVDDILIVKKGERIPVDGVVVKGESVLDTSALTGESELVNVNIGNDVLSGSINMGNVIEMKVTSLFENSIVSKILNLLESATDKKTKTETIVSKISKIYTPVVLVLALLIIILFPLIFNISIKDSVYRGLTFLVISCPCAIAISVPLSYFTGIGVASINGILIKGTNYLDNLSDTSSIIFDKTGTLTNGAFTVSKIEISDKWKDKYSLDEIINILIKGESFSNHPIAKSILKLKDDEIENSDIKDYEEITGKGVSFKFNNKKIFIGNNKLCNCDNDVMLHLNIDGEHVASIFIDDGIKEHAKEVIKMFKSYNIKTYMFTGDKKDIALDIGNKIGIDEIKYEMLPQDKYENFELVSKNNKITIFVGDGINDAPVLKRADIGISMGSVGTDSAIEASDVVLMNDRLDRIPLAIDISRYTKKIIKQNLLFAIIIKVITLLLSVLGLANMWMAVFADTGVTLLTILNTLRIMNKYRN